MNWTTAGSPFTNTIRSLSLKVFAPLCQAEAAVRSEKLGLGHDGDSDRRKRVALVSVTNGTI